MEFKRLNFLGGLGVLLVSLITYLMTVSPTVSFWDCGEFIATAHTMAVPHPPGAPFYLMIGRLFSMLPIGSDIAFRVNLISVVASAFTCMFLYLSIIRLIAEFRGAPKSAFDKFSYVAAGVIGALTFSFTDSFWFSAVEAEVYALSMFFTAIVIWLMMLWSEHYEDYGNQEYILAISYMVGLAIGVHLLNILALPTVLMIIFFKNKRLAAYSALGLGLALVVAFLPEIPVLLKVLSLPVFAYVVYRYKESNVELSMSAIIPILVLVGYSAYLMVFIRSGMNPNIDENNPETWENFIKYLKREQYGTDSLFATVFNRSADFWGYQIEKMYFRYFNWQFLGKFQESMSLIDHIRESLFGSFDSNAGRYLNKHGYVWNTVTSRGLYGLPLLLGIWGVIAHFNRDWKRMLAILAFFVATGIGIVVYTNPPDPQPRERDYVFVASFFAFAIWIGMGMWALLDAIRNWLTDERKAQWAAYGTTTLVFIFIPINMAVYNYHEHDRSDNYVAWDYSYNMLMSCEENAIVFTNGDNDTFPLWYLQEVEKVRTDIRVVNLSLLNTPWYVDQLKNLSPHGAIKVPISLKDSEISLLQPRRFSEQNIELPVPKDLYWKDWQESGNALPAEWENQPIPKLKWTMKPTIAQNRAIRVQDLMILDIVAANKWKYPIYFAVTVSSGNRIGLNNYLRMDGLAYKLLTVRNQDISEKILADKIFNVFRYRELDNPDVYYDDTASRLIAINYRSCFLQLADKYRKKRQNDKVIETLDKMNEIIPEHLFKLDDYRISLNIGQLYEAAGRPEELVKRIEFVNENYSLSNKEKLQLAALFQYTLKDYERSIEILRPITELEPNNGEAFGLLVNAYESSQRYAEAVTLLKTWLEQHPDDNQGKIQLAQMEKKLSQQTDSVEVN